MHRLELLTAVTRAARDLEFEPFLQTVLSAAAGLTRSEAAAILEYDDRTRSLRFLAVPPANQDLRHTPPIPLEESTAGLAIRQCRPLRIPEPGTDPRPLTGVDLQLASRTQSVAVVPLTLKGKVLGVLEAVNTSQPHYTEEDVSVLETLAAVTALAMDHNALRLRMEASLAELAELDRLKSDFIAITSHELRTPLGVILGHATYLRELLEPEYRQQIDVIIRNASRLKDIVESAASMDNYGTGRARVRPQAVSIAGIIAEVAASFADMAADRNISLQVSPVPEDLLVEADHTKVSIALGNLVKNALTFTNEGGHVLIRAEAVPGYVKVSVTDDGIGIPRQDLPRIFDRFFQVERHLTRRHNGMGLGLSVAKVMVEMHGGRIWVESVEGKGSTFSFLLPVQAAHGQPAMF
ncbi:MAG TPA: GAF domain-containing sensor histidine kinase [Anaerolineales bacterium]